MSNITMLITSLLNLITQAKTAIIQANTTEDLESIRTVFLGKNGHFNQKIKQLNTLEYQEKIKFGLLINQSKEEISKLFIEQKQVLELEIVKKLLNTSELDVTLPGRHITQGTFHPITKTINHIKKFFNRLGFSEVYGPEIEDSYFNFDALNIPIHHPSRNQKDTFWFDATRLLRTHTSGVQVRVMTNSVLPIRVISVGRVYRKDHDKYHTPMFHQVEGILVDSHLNLSNLKKILYDFLLDFFGKQTVLRFRPSYFPFTEPSAEIDIMIQEKEQKDKTNWLELLGCGVIHPTVLHNTGIDSNKFTGLAFGMGIERLTMLLYQISDMRIFFENNLQFLNQFQ